MSVPHLPEAELPSRVARIETIVEQLASELGQHVAQTNAAIERLASTTQTALANQAEQAEAGRKDLSESFRKVSSETNASIQSLSLRTEESRRAPWSTLAAWAGVVLAIGGVFGSIVMREISATNERASKLEDSRVDNARDFGRRDECQRWMEKELERLRAGKAP